MTQKLTSVFGKYWPVVENICWWIHERQGKATRIYPKCTIIILGVWDTTNNSYSLVVYNGIHLGINRNMNVDSFGASMTALLDRSWFWYTADTTSSWISCCLLSAFQDQVYGGSTKLSLKTPDASGGNLGLGESLIIVMAGVEMFVVRLDNLWLAAVILNTWLQHRH